MNAAPKGFRLHIGIFGRRNVGKSSLLNAITRQQVSIVSEFAGTTTDPVEKPMELLPLGPVLFIDTAGLDDTGVLGGMRVEKTRLVFDRTELGVIVAEAGGWGEFEEQLLAELKTRGIPIVAVFNKSDVAAPDDDVVEKLTSAGVRTVVTDAVSGEGILDFRQALLDAAPDEFLNNPVILRDLVPPGEVAVLVIPIDKEAPKGRIILPQVQCIRDLLDNGSLSLVTRECELRDAIDKLNRPPAIVVTDSQAFRKVVDDTPLHVKVTSFSILYARFKGDLNEMVRGAAAIDGLRQGANILIAESCAHHPIGEDIGRVKIPLLLTRHVEGNLEFTHIQGHDFPIDPSPYDLVIQCGACMTNRREVLSRVLRCRRAGVPITNYGLTLAFLLGIMERALEPFPSALEAYRDYKCGKAIGRIADEEAGKQPARG